MASLLSLRELALRDLWFATWGVSLIVAGIGAIVIQMHQSHEDRRETQLSLDAKLLAMDVETEAVLDGVPSSMEINKSGLITFNGDPTAVSWARLATDTKLEYYRKHGETYSFCLVNDSGFWAWYEAGRSEAVTGKADTCKV